MNATWLTNHNLTYLIGGSKKAHNSFFSGILYSKSEWLNIALHVRRFLHNQGEIGTEGIMPYSLSNELKWVFFNAEYGRQHCTLQAFEQFGTVHMHNLDDKHLTRGRLSGIRHRRINWRSSAHHAEWDVAYLIFWRWASVEEDLRILKWTVRVCRVDTDTIALDKDKYYIWWRTGTTNTDLLYLPLHHVHTHPIKIVICTIIRKCIIICRIQHMIIINVLIIVNIQKINKYNLENVLCRL